MKTLIVLLCVVTVAIAAKVQDPFQDLFENLAQELAVVFRNKYDSHHVVTQAECLQDCKDNLPLGDEMCKDVCIEAGLKFPHVSST